MTDLSYLTTEANAISTASSRIRKFAQDAAKELVALDQRIAAIEAAATPAPTPVPDPTPVPAEPPAPAPSYLFHDEFDGPAGAPPDPLKWINKDGIVIVDGSAAKAKNAFLDGNGCLVLRVTRESWTGSDGKTRLTAGGVVGSYQYQTGWPPKPILASWPVPFRYEVKFKTPTVPGFWCGPGWNQNVDRSAGYVEIDVAETRSTLPGTFGCNMHTWTKNSDGSYTDAPKWGQNASGVPGAWHVMTCDARAEGTTFFLDGALVGTGFAVTGKFGVLLHNVLADATSWGAGGLQPPATDPGPWDLLVDYVRVAAL